MAVSNPGPKTFTATSAVTQHRRVKLTTSSGTAVEHAGAGEAFIGLAITDAATDERVAVWLTNNAQTVKAIASEAFSAGATLYGAAAGKVADTSSGTAQGTALTSASADGDTVEVLFDNGAASSLDGASTAIAVLTGAVNGGLPIIFKKAITDATTSVTIFTAQYDCLIIDWWLIARDADAANIKLVNDSTDATAVVAKGTTNDAIVRGGTLIAAQDEVSSGDPLKVNASAAEPFDIFVMVVRI